MASCLRRLCWCCSDTVTPPISPGVNGSLGGLGTLKRSPRGVGGMNGGQKGEEDEQPMPDQEELDKKFAELVGELGLDKEHEEAMFCLPPEKKWQIYCSQKRDQEILSSSSRNPEEYIDVLKRICRPTVTNRLKDSSLKGVQEEDEDALNGLKMALRTQPMTFVLRFLELGGLTSLFDFLSGMSRETCDGPLHTAVIGCITNLMNSAEGRSHVLALPDSICRLAESLRTTNARTKISVLEILGAICIVPGGHRRVLQAMVHFQTFSKERTRYQTLVLELDRTMDDVKSEVILKTAIMSFINASIKYGPGATQLEFRLHLRYEFLMLGIETIMEKLRAIDNITLKRHLDFFELVRNEDEKEWAKRFAVTHVDSRSVTTMCELLRKKLTTSPAYLNLQSILFHLLQLPFASTRLVAYWQLIDRIIQQIVLQKKGVDSDTAPLQLDVSILLSQLTNEESAKDANLKIRELQTENEELTTRLTKKDRECQTKTQEKDELLQTFNRFKTKQEKELNDANIKIEELSSKILELQNLLRTGTGSPGGSDPLTFNFTPRLPSSSTTPTDEQKSGGFGGAPPPPAPPPPPAMLSGSGSPPPPPPPPLPGLGGGGGDGGVKLKAYIPTPTQPLKSFNWVKIADNKLGGTIWADISDSRIYKSLDLDDFEKNFSAYQRKETNDLDKGQQSKVKELTVIDGRRAQNCTILLSKLKMSCYELSEAILTVDPQDDIPRDMCEQLLKFVPTNEEVQMLNEHSHELEQMAKADYFLFQMSRVDHYEDRLKALYYKKKYNERINDAVPKIKAVSDASEEVMTSKSLRRVLELVLALGNYMNRGQRGNASGFRVASLNKIVDTKSSIDRKLNLVHYLANIIDNTFTEAADLGDELQSVKEAAKVNRNDLEAEINVLRTGLKDIQKVLEVQRRRINRSSVMDQFISVLTEFIEVASFRFNDLEEDFNEMRLKYEQAVSLFGEDVKTTQPEEFFGIFSTFMTSLDDARLENVQFQRQKELEERRGRSKGEGGERERSLHRLTSKEQLNIADIQTTESQSNDFDELISALRTGDVFRDELLKDRRAGGRGGRKGSSPGPALGGRKGSAPFITSPGIASPLSPGGGRTGSLLNGERGSHVTSGQQLTSRLDQLLAANESRERVYVIP